MQIQDTPDYILQKQFEIMYSKTKEEKLAITFNMMQLSYDMAYNLVKKQNPTFSYREIIAKRFEMMHGDSFSEEEKQRIITYLLQCA